MRVKHSVDFQIDLKKSSKGKDAVAESTREEGWVSSKCSNSDLETLVKQGFFPSKSIIQWCPALGDAVRMKIRARLLDFFHILSED